MGGNSKIESSKITINRITSIAVPMLCNNTGAAALATEPLLATSVATALQHLLAVTTELAIGVAAFATETLVLAALATAVQHP